MAKKSIAVLTSGGDSQGMNAAIRAIVRNGLKSNYNMFLIHEGYDGLVSVNFSTISQEEANRYIRQVKWFDVSDYIARGGTNIGSARSAKFRTVEGRKLAAKNLLHFGIEECNHFGGSNCLR